MPGSRQGWRRGSTARLWREEARSMFGIEDPSKQLPRIRLRAGFGPNPRATSVAWGWPSNGAEVQNSRCLFVRRATQCASRKRKCCRRPRRAVPAPRYGDRSFEIESMAQKAEVHMQRMPRSNMQRGRSESTKPAFWPSRFSLLVRIDPRGRLEQIPGCHCDPSYRRGRVLRVLRFPLTVPKGRALSIPAIPAGGSRRQSPESSQIRRARPS